MRAISLRSGYQHAYIAATGRLVLPEILRLAPRYPGVRRYARERPGLGAGRPGVADGISSPVHRHPASAIRELLAPARISGCAAAGRTCESEGPSIPRRTRRGTRKIHPVTVKRRAGQLLEFGSFNVARPVEIARIGQHLARVVAAGGHDDIFRGGHRKSPCLRCRYQPGKYRQYQRQCRSLRD